MWTAFFIGVGVMCGVTSLLAILMVAADRTIARYGPCTITVNDRDGFTIEGGRSLLATLKEENVFIPSACGGRGSCGLCKVKVLSGAGKTLPTELPWLSDDEKASGIRLSCQIRVKADLRIAVPAELLNVRQYAAEVARIRNLTHDIREVTLRLGEPPSMAFTAGQFVQFEVPPYDLTEEPVYRAYSISSSPSRENEIELEIRYVPNGICTTYIFQHLKEGMPVTVNGPYGDFRLTDSPRAILFIAGGSGMAPIKSMLYRMREQNDPRRTRYFFGAKARCDLFLLDEMHRLEKDLADFAFVPALSEPGPDDEWTGERGLVTEVVDRSIERPADFDAYLCGSPLMIDACIEVLKGKGMPESQIFFDKFA